VRVVCQYARWTVPRKVRVAIAGACRKPSQAGSSVAKSRRPSRSDSMCSASGWRLRSRAHRSPHEASEQQFTCSPAAATKLLHAVSAECKLLTCQRELGLSLQSIIGATLTFLLIFKRFASIPKVIYQRISAALL
jgi:hypothetical protein